ncbi:SDR family NAD(P)-dependent oxidoreductase [Pedobacter psychroterrae]|uniref:Glucose 1-dehydrogenase n=1 Tax=Pedobacter psychroterrae TaxID=2530453 RepID=A0A4R0NNM6_9SPHI|nr:glucose 1-dehydrogenase [Pedobacter psychroterrae]TCD02532.1 glucose 1-dehydrogenase [Pedobacter psychroterrae]
MENKTVIVTGGSTGIGKATALAFAKNGYNVVISGRNNKAGEEALKEIKETGAEALFVATDVTNELDVVNLISKTKDTFKTIDVFVNNAGIAGATEGFLADSSEQNLRSLFETNVIGVFFGMKHAIKSMQEAGGGSIVNLASIAGLNGIPYAAQYCASKHAVVGLTKAAAVEYATQGIRINAIAPGAIKTDILKSAIESGSYSEETIAAIHPMKRLGTVEDIANGIYYLGSSESPFMTGHVLAVDGGYNAQ